MRVLDAIVGNGENSSFWGVGENFGGFLFLNIFGEFLRNF